jgi:tetratricopeptide (TPR) repeat protein
MLKDQDVDPLLLGALESLLGRGFDDEQSFLKAIYDLNPAPQTDEYAATILRCADSRFRRAAKLLEQAYNEHMRGKLIDAIRLYKRSIELFPTAEAHTFLGWAYSFQNRYAEAIEECEQAILADTDFGNPYNDIGSYLIALDRLDEAIPWLIKATEAKRYEPRHFPWANLGRVYELQGNWEQALESYIKAHEIEPGYEYAVKSIERLCGPPELLN